MEAEPVEISTIERMRRALELYQAGQLEAAAHECLGVLACDANHVDALHLLAAVRLTQGDAAGAIPLLERAIRLPSPTAAMHHHLGTAYRTVGNTARAADSYRVAIRLNPTAFDLQHDLATLLHAAGQTAEAEVHYRRTIELEPTFGAAQNNLGNCLLDQGRHVEAGQVFAAAAARWADVATIQFNFGNSLRAAGNDEGAIAAYRRALELDPGLAVVHHNLGAILLRQERFDAALEQELKALALSPDYYEALLGQAAALCGLNRTAEAAEVCRQAIALEPDSALGYHNLGSALETQREHHAALAAYRTAERLDPAYAETQLGLATCLRNLAETPAALACAQRAIEVDPRHIKAHYFYGCLLFSQGDFARGYPHFEWRLKDTSAGRGYSHEMWSGQELRSKEILVRCEWGCFGDTFQFLRYVPMIRERGGKPVIEVNPGLIHLLTAAGFRCVAMHSVDPQDFPHQVPLMSLPRVFGTTLETIPALVPYLRAHPGLCEYWASELRTLPGLKIGIHWRGAERFGADTRAVPLTAFEPLARTPGVTLVSLQKNNGHEELDQLAGRFPVVDFGDALDTKYGSFMDTAAIVTQLDLVISTDTSVAHLAGALGVPVWVPLERAAEWRWMHDREDSPWYPTMRLYRQTEFDRWTDVFARIAGDLAALIAAKRHGGP